MVYAAALRKRAYQITNFTRLTVKVLCSPLLKNKHYPDTLAEVVDSLQGAKKR
jgi:hypothetical protein